MCGMDVPGDCPLYEYLSTYIYRHMQWSMRRPSSLVEVIVQYLERLGALTFNFIAFKDRGQILTLTNTIRPLNVSKDAILGQEYRFLRDQHNKV
jgi:hypothetical protein